MTSNIGSFGKYTVTRQAMNSRRTAGGSYAQKSRSANNGVKTENTPTRTRNGKDNAGTNQQLSYQQLTDAMNVLNQFGSLTGGSRQINTNTSSSAATGAAAPTAGNTGAAGGAGGDASSMSGLAQGIEHEVLDGVDTSSLRYLENALDEGSFKEGSISYYSPRNYTEINTNLNAQKRKVNSALAKEQANFNSIQTQKQTAEANVTRLESQVEGAAQAQTDAKSNLDKYSGELKQQTQARDKADDQLASLNEGYKGVCEDVKSKEKSKSSAQDKVTSAKQSVAQSEAAVKSAEQSVQSAQSALDSTPPTLEDGSPNPAYQQAQAALRQAESQKQQAEQSLKDAQAYEEECNTNLETANSELEASQEKKHTCLDNIKQTDEQCKSYAEQCEKLQTSVEQQQESYDTAREVHDDASANHERLNSELETQQGILTEYEAIESNLDALKETAGQIEGIEKKLDKAMKDYNNNLSPEGKADIENRLRENANATEGCGMNKTPKENLLSCTQADIDRLATGNGVLDTWQENQYIDGFTAEDFASKGYKQNSDGSFTDPRTGVTMVNVYGNYWQSNVADGGIYENAMNNQFPDISAVRARAFEQQNIRLNGQDANGSPKFRWIK